ncbi:MAG: hypothetical protein VX938_11710, partial [Myxococcota bacterium]|nr:hypothetical protein [Myxococcota bacterium]
MKRLLRCVCVMGLATALMGVSPTPQALAGEATYSDLVGQAVAARKAGDLPGAAEALEKAGALRPSPELSNNLARV